MKNLYKINDSSIDIMKEPWDVLVILDACRFDYFKMVYNDFFPDAELERAISPATSTMEWLLSIFQDNSFSDIVYVSGTPYVNSRIETISPLVGSFKAKEHFSEIEDVWEWGWDTNINSVNPWNVNKGFFRQYKKRNPDTRYILHYMQPHAPYRKLKWETQKAPSAGARGNRQENLADAIKRFVGEHSTKWFGQLPIWVIGRLLHIPCRYPMQQAFYKKGIKGLRALYLDNLIFGLEAVSALTDVINGKILLTSDHGERLGEHFRFGHFQPRHREVTEVPWLWIN